MNITFHTALEELVSVPKTSQCVTIPTQHSTHTSPFFRAPERAFAFTVLQPEVSTTPTQSKHHTAQPEAHHRHNTRQRWTFYKLVQCFIHAISAMTGGNSLMIQSLTKRQLPLNFSSFSKFWLLSRNNSGLSGFSFISDVIRWGKRNYIISMKATVVKIVVSLYLKLSSVINTKTNLWTQQNKQRTNTAELTATQQGTGVGQVVLIKFNILHWRIWQVNTLLQSLSSLVRRVSVQHELKTCYCTSMASMYWSSVVNMPVWPLGSQGQGGERGITVLGSLSQHSTPPLSLHTLTHHLSHHTTPHCLPESATCPSRNSYAGALRDTNTPLHVKRPV